VTRKVAVVGGGIAGLAVSYELIERAERAPGSVEILCLEASHRPGGNIRTEREQGFLIEWAANGFLDSAPATITLVRRLGLEPLRSRAAAERRFVFRRGRLREVPLSPRAFLGSGALSPLGKLRVLAEPLVPRRKPTADEESVFDFAARRIGREAASVLVDAMVRGVFAGDARRLSLEACFPAMRRMETEHGGLFRALLARRRAARAGNEGEGEAGGGAGGPAGVLTSFRAGMQQLTDGLAAALGPRLELGTAVQQISDRGRRGFRLLPARGAPLDVDAVVVTCPAWRAAPMLESLDRDIAGALGAIRSAPVTVVHCGYRRDALGALPEGFGFLVPRDQGPRILGALWASDIFEERAPAGSLLVTVMAGGAPDPALAELADDELLQVVRGDLERTMRILVAPYFVRIIRHERGIPQYELGHLERLATIERRLGQFPGLWLGGSSLHGVAVNSCIERAAPLAESVLEFVAAGARSAAV